MSKIGYARVSSVGQNLDAQLEKLKDCEKVFKERVSGISMNRPQFKKMMKFVREGDTICVTKIDRLARNVRDLLNIKHMLEERKIALIVTDQNIDTTTPVGNLLFNMLSVFAEFENDLRKENQADGIETAKKRGIKFGRKKVLAEQQIEEIKQMRNDGYMIREIMEKFNVSKATVYRTLGPAENTLFE
jgi:DNA invertase Pin-like site-specific DNA recombinase